MRVFEFHFYSLKEDFRRDSRELMRSDAGIVTDET